ncbi:MAG: transketolase family protein, partial [Candidatus Lokiarchaeota archaeon]|nr:transketolase family protein [Candidatus Lokiarchaeota archaeon]
MSEIFLRETFGNFIVEKADIFKNMVVLNADLSSSTKTDKFAQKYPNRFFNFGIAEQNMVGAAMGFAISGKIPIISGFSLFTTGRAWEFIRLACHDNLNIKIVTTHAGLVGPDGSTHSALEDLSIMSALPNLNIIVPADNIELIEILNYALDIEGPFYIRLPRGGFKNIHTNNYKFQPKKPDIIKDGMDICIIGIGYGSNLAYQSILKLEQNLDISIKFINQSIIKPIIIPNFISEVKDTQGVLVIEEHNTYCGVGSIICRIISENNPKPVRVLGIKNSFGQSGNRNELLDFYGFNYKNIEKLVKELLSHC